MNYRYNFDPSLYLILDFAILGNNNLEYFIKAAIHGGVSLIQLREKKLSTREFVELGRFVKNILNPLKVPLIINDRVDVSLACQASGVHIGQSDMNYQDARKILGNNSVIGITVENTEHALSLNDSDVDYFGVSSIFQTSTKLETKSLWGIEGLKSLRAQTQKKLIAIGGINSSNACNVLTAGADGLAVASAICASSNPEFAAKELRQKFINRKREHEL